MLTIGMVAGELSGDTLGADLIREIKKTHPDARFLGIGGPQMQAEGLTSLYPLERLSLFGLFEVLGRLPELFRIRDGLVETFEQEKIDVFIGVDAPDFNLRLSKKLKDRQQHAENQNLSNSHLIKTVQYVSPSVWAWRQGRVVSIGASVDLVLCLLPFEVDFYTKHDVHAVFVGHPLARMLPLDHQVETGKQELGISPEQTIIGLLPGSRSSEVTQVGGILLESAGQLLKQFPALRFMIPAANEARLTQIKALVADQPQAVQQAVQVLEPDDRAMLSGNLGRRVMAASDIVMLASGTATLEALLLGRPMVVVGRVHWLTYLFVRWMIKIPWLSLPNILAGRRLVPELIQSQATVSNVVADMKNLLSDPTFRLGPWQTQHVELERIHTRLKSESVSSAADAVLALVPKESIDATV
ncbi:lipid-A-disaccharide synthase [Aquirhabdus sp.]|uniref:lipid-A-disaccharide synthase n=1 Tax=Aquirhabdus sp. TaxID=2824160 RepID=UPI00396C5977